MQKKYHFRLAVEEDSERILNYLQDNFAKAEPCIRALGLSSTELNPVFQLIIKRSLQSPFSTIVLTDEGEVAGVMLNSIWRRTDSSQSADYEENKEMSEEIIKFAEFLNKVHDGFWDLAPKNVNAVIHREISSVGVPYQRQGIAKRLVTENITQTKLKQFEIDGIISETTSFANQNLLGKQGFKCLKEVPYSEVLNSEGKRLLKTEDGSTGCRLNFKAIDEFDIFRL